MRVMTDRGKLRHLIGCLSIFALAACEPSGGGGGTGGGGPPKLTRKKTATGETLYQLTGAMHPLLVNPAITPAGVTAVLGDADDRWVHDADLSDTEDYPANVSFTFTGSIGSTFPPPWNDNKYNEIGRAQDVASLSLTPDMSEWILFVKSTYDNKAYGTFNAARIIMPEDGWQLPGVYAHEIGHNAGLNDRSAPPVGGLFVPIMESAPGDYIRELANLTEVRKMILP